MINVFLEDKETVIDWKAIAKLLGIYNTRIITETALLTIFTNIEYFEHSFLAFLVLQKKIL